MNAVAKIDQHNPIGTDGFEFVEFTAPTPEGIEQLRQLFGAMGFTWENDLQFALKRAKAGELLLGGAAEHRAVIAEEFDAADF